MLKNLKCVVNICCYAPRRMYTHNAHPCFEWYIPSKLPILRKIFCGKWQYKWWFFMYFWKIKGMNLQNNSVYEGWSIINWCMKGVHEWDWVHKRFLCPRATPSGINNRACTQSHSWTPNFTESPLKIVLQNNRKQRQFFLLRGYISKSIWTSFCSFHNLTFIKCWPF